MKYRDKLSKSPINYFSDLFICAMVVMWIIDNIYEAIIASVVTVSSIMLSFQTGCAYFDTSMWASIGSNVAIPLSCGGALWMIKNGIQHAIANHNGKQAHMDFPAVHPDGENDEIELSQTIYENKDAIAVDFPDEINAPVDPKEVTER